MKKEELFKNLQDIYNNMQDKTIKEFNEDENNLMQDSLRFGLISDMLNECEELTKWRIYLDLKEELEK